MTAPPNGTASAINKTGGIVQIIATIATISAGMWMMAIRPLQLELNQLRATIDSHISQPGHPQDHEKLSALDSRFAEVETQFFWLGDVSNGERADNDRIVRMLWKRVYNDELPEKNVYQRGPARR